MKEEAGIGESALSEPCAWITLIIEMTWVYFITIRSKKRIKIAKPDKHHSFHSIEKVEKSNENVKDFFPHKLTRFNMY